jgi:hypothetical protein
MIDTFYQSTKFQGSRSGMPCKKQRRWRKNGRKSRWHKVLNLSTGVGGHVVVKLSTLYFPEYGWYDLVCNLLNLSGSTRGLSLLSVFVLCSCFRWWMDSIALDGFDLGKKRWNMLEKKTLSIFTCPKKCHISHIRNHVKWCQNPVVHWWTPWNPHFFSDFFDAFQGSAPRTQGVSAYAPQKVDVARVKAPRWAIVCEN